MSKVFLGVGHGGTDPGAVSGHFKEKDMTLVIATACKDELVRHGVEVIMSRTKDENDPVSDEVRECNAFKPDLAVDVHINAGGGDGFEVYHYSKGGTSKVLAQNIEAEVKAIGQNSRGLKTRLSSNGKDYYAFIRDTYAAAVICEAVFIDNKTDMQIADTIEEQKMFGVAYAKGILKTLGIAYIEPVDKVYWIVTGGMSKESALEQVETLKGLNGWYSHVEQKQDGYYRLAIGGFVGEDTVIAKMNALKELTGWYMTYELR